MELKKEVKVYKVDYICDKCGKGKMLPNGMALMTYPAQYTHVCNNCGSAKTFNEQYPKIIYEEIEQ